MGSKSLLHSTPSTPNLQPATPLVPRGVANIQNAMNHRQASPSLILSQISSATPFFFNIYEVELSFDGQRKRV
jgi:hypothetical protein